MLRWLLTLRPLYPSTNSTLTVHSVSFVTLPGIVTGTATSYAWRFSGGGAGNATDCSYSKRSR